MKKLLFILLISLLSFFAIKPLFQSGFFPFHDNAQVSRVYEMRRAIDDGMFPVRWSEDFGYGYGYPIFNFYAPGAYYIGAFMLLFTHGDPLAGTKLLIAMGIIFSGVFMYLFSREFWGDGGGLVSALLYLYAPYHAVDVYVRGDIAEFWAYTFIPLAFWGFYKVFLNFSGDDFLQEKSVIKDQISLCAPVAKSSATCDRYSYEAAVTKIKNKRNTWPWILIGAIGFAGIILSHNLTAMMVTPFLFLMIISFGFISYQKTKSFRSLFLMLYTFFLGLLLSAFYWVPVLFEVSFTNVLSQIAAGFDFHKHFVCFSQFWYSPWGYGGSVPGCTDGLSFMLGKVHSILSVLAVMMALLFWKKEPKSKLVLFVGVCLLLALLLTTTVSQPLWETISLMSFFQFPWRFLILVMFFMSFISGFVLYGIRNLIIKRNKIIFPIIILITIAFVIFFYNKLFFPKAVYQQASQSFTDRNYIAWNLSNDAHEYLPKSFIVPSDITEIPSHVFEVGSGYANINNITTTTNRKTANIISRTFSVIHINVAYFPAWHVYEDGKDHIFTVTNSGMNVVVPSGKHILSIEFHQTLVEKLANVISLISFLLLFIGIIFRKRFSSIY